MKSVVTKSPEQKRIRVESQTARENNGIHFARFDENRKGHAIRKSIL